MKKSNLLKMLRMAGTIMVFAGCILSLNQVKPTGIILQCVGLGLMLWHTKRNPDEEKNAMIRFQSMGRRMLLPATFKKVGFGIAIVGWGLFLFFLPDKSNLWWGIIILGLLVAMCSRERNEDELVREVRLRSAWVALLFMVMWFCLVSFIPTESRLSPGMGVVMGALFYHFMFYSIKRKVDNGGYN